jgi:hypothetical protein
MRGRVEEDYSKLIPSVMQMGSISNESFIRPADGTGKMAFA